MPPNHLFSLPFILLLLSLVKKEELRTLERKLVVLLDEQQRELESIRRRQEKKGELLVSAYSSRHGGSAGDIVGAGANGPSAKDKRQAAQLVQSTETLMKFGFMSMSMTYFSSLNMIRAMRSVGALDTVMAALAHSADAPGARDGGGGGVEEDSRALALSRTKILTSNHSDRRSSLDRCSLDKNHWQPRPGASATLLGVCRYISETPDARNSPPYNHGNEGRNEEGSNAPQARERGCLARFRFCTVFFSLQCVWFLSSTDQEERAGVLRNILEGSSSVVCEFI